MNKINVYTNESLLSKAVAEFIIDLAQQSIADTGRFTIALSGGKTPSTLFTLLAQSTYSKRLNWKQVFVFWGDERCVPADDERNNSFVARQLLLNQVKIPTENIFAVPVRLSPEKAAKSYEAAIRQFFRVEHPVFDLILLGMGDNGHTASLFPGTEILKEKTALVKEVFIPELDMWRVSFTAPFINQAKNILFLVTGKSKAAMLQQVLEEKPNALKYPAQMIKAAKGHQLSWFLDKPAASKLSS
ncbi:MAG: 6-phosphogluconolactonase [Ferruginibacter sp.]|nr:6-phosphogluconolactonase [Ferruginibacter sp.]